MLGLFDFGFALLTLSGRLFWFGVSFAQRFAISGWLANIHFSCALLLNGIGSSFFGFFASHLADTALLSRFSFSDFGSQGVNLILQLLSAFLVRVNYTFQFTGQVDVLLHQGLHRLALFVEVRDVGAILLASLVAFLVRALSHVLDGHAVDNHVNFIDDTCRFGGSNVSLKCGLQRVEQVIHCDAHLVGLELQSSTELRSVALNEQGEARLTQLQVLVDVVLDRGLFQPIAFGQLFLRFVRGVMPGLLRHECSVQLNATFPRFGVHHTQDVAYQCGHIV